MSPTWLQRTHLLLGSNVLSRLQSMHILVVGVGGVGAYCAEMLVRAGLGEITIVDADVVEESNRNRQLLALTTTELRPKVEVMAERLLQINPDLHIHSVHEFIRDERTISLLQSTHFDYVVDAIDSLSPKVFLIYHTLQQHIKLVSAMGAGGKMDPSLVQVADISKTFQCRLAHAIRKRLHKMGITNGFLAVFSPEPVRKSSIIIDENPAINKLSTVGTISYMPAVFGCFAASAIIRDIEASMP